MLTPLQFLMVFLSPRGRVPYAFFRYATMVLVGIQIVLSRSMHFAMENDQSLKLMVLEGFYLLAIWINFCLASRRMHDMGRESALLIFSLIAVGFSFLGSHYPSLLGDSDEQIENTMTFLFWMRQMVALSNAVLWMKPGDPAASNQTNAFGPPLFSGRVGAKGHQPKPAPQTQQKPTKLARGIDSDRLNVAIRSNRNSGRRSIG